MAAPAGRGATAPVASCTLATPAGRGATAVGPAAAPAGRGATAAGPRPAARATVGGLFVPADVDAICRRSLSLP